MSQQTSSLTIVLTGGGSGGHITPIQAVAAELKRLQPDSRLIYIGQTGDGLSDIPAADPHIDEVYTIRAGKFRRYHGEGWKQLLDVSTMVKNIRDAFYVLIGLVQSRRLLKRLQPNIIFIKGGFVGVPVGLAAASLRLPFVTHDSDALPGLANRIIARWARIHAVALPAEVYTYPRDKTVTTGIPLQADFVPVTATLQQQYRSELDIPTDAKLLFVIGGGLGAERINSAVAEAVPHLLHEFPNLYVLHGVGRLHESAMQARYDEQLAGAARSRVRTFGYLKDVYRYSGAADIIITRAGATNLAEFALQGKACIVIPSAVLAGGHQLKNAQYLESQQAALIINETDLTADPNRLAKQASELLRDTTLRAALSREFAKFAKPDATRMLAQLLLKEAERA
jgi:UDP-N-acetylglucosamine--N-acetylmuramyl-(pentapeptide) pyrophosphoryl-undecaprenol N-acetylglucosamine transferase